MLIQIKNIKGDSLITIKCNPDNIEFEDIQDEKFRSWLKEQISGGITQTKEVYNPDSKTYSIIEGPIEKNDANYCLVLKDFLKRSGYVVIEKHPEIEEEIKEILKKIPDDNEDKKIILEKLHNLSYLEQTTILEELKSK